MPAAFRCIHAEDCFLTAAVFMSLSAPFCIRAVPYRSEGQGSPTEKAGSWTDAPP